MQGLSLFLFPFFLLLTQFAHADSESKEIENQLFKEEETTAVPKLIDLYENNPELRFQRLYRHGSLQDTPGLRDSEREATAFYSAFIAEEKIKQKPNYETKGLKIKGEPPLIQGNMSVVELSWRRLLTITNAKDEAPDLLTLEWIRHVLQPQFISFISVANPFDFRKGIFLLNYSLALSLTSKPKMTREIFNDYGENANKWLYRIILECATKKPINTLEEALLPFCEKKAYDFLEQELPRLGLQKYIQPALREFNVGNPSSLSNLVTHVPNLDRNLFDKFADKTDLFAFPSPDDELAGKGKTLPYNALKLKILQSMEGIQIHRRDAVQDASPEIALTMLASDGTKATLCADGSGDAAGCYYKKDKKSTDIPEVGASKICTQMTLYVDGYMRNRESDKSQDARFWLGASAQPAKDAQWIAIRIKTNAEYLSNEWAFMHFLHFLQRETYFPIEEQLLETPEYQAEFKRLKDQHTFGGGGYRDLIPINYPDFISKVVKKLEAIYRKESFIIEPPEVLNNFSCLAGCLYKDPIAIEPKSGWMIFLLAPERQTPVLFESKVKTGVTRVPDNIANGRSFFHPIVVETFDFSSNNFLNSQWELKGKSGMSLFPPMLPAQLGMDVKDMPGLPSFLTIPGLLYFVESYDRHQKPGGWLNPEPRGRNRLMSAGLALLHLEMLSEIEKYNSLDKLPAEETQSLPWKQRLSFVQKSIPANARKISSEFLPKIEKMPDEIIEELYALFSLKEDIKLALKSSDQVTSEYLQLLAMQSSELLATLPPKTKDLIELRHHLTEAYEIVEFRFKQKRTEMKMVCLLLDALRVSGGTWLGDQLPDGQAISICQDVKSLIEAGVQP